MAAIIPERGIACRVTFVCHAPASAERAADQIPAGADFVAEDAGPALFRCRQQMRLDHRGMALSGYARSG